MQVVTDYREQAYALQYLRPCAGPPFPMIPIYYEGNRHSREMSVYTHCEAFPHRYNIFRTREGTYLLRNLEKELLTACMYGHYDAVYELVSHKELIINFQDDLGNTPLHYACWYMERTSDPRISALLVYCGANPVIYNHDGFFPIIHTPFAKSSAAATTKNDA
jgi:hypothetical protein